MNRRSVLAGVTGLGVASLSGCLQLGDSEPSPATTIGWMSVSNHDPDSSQEIDLRIERDGNVVHRSSHTIPAKDGRSVAGAVPDCTWEPKPGEYVVSARPDGGEWTKRNVTQTDAGTARDCVTVLVDYGSSAGEQSWVDPDDPLSIAVVDWCDRIGELDGGCPAYQDWEYESTTASN